MDKAIRKTLFALGAAALTLFVLSSGIAILAHKASADTSTGLIGHWSFDEGSGTTAADSSGSGSTGTLAGATIPIWTTGQIGGALSFDGASSYVNTGGRALNSYPATICAWVNPQLKSNGSSVNIVRTIGFDLNAQENDGKFKFGTYNNVNNVYTPYSARYAAGSWYNVCVTVDTGNTASVYVNGALAAGPANIGAAASFTSLSIGGSSSGGYLKGAIDDVRLYNRALSASDISELYASGSGSVPPPSPPPPPVAVNGACGSSVNSCASGTFSDIADSAAQALWNCVGSNGGTTASCSSPISVSPPPTPPPSVPVTTAAASCEHDDVLASINVASEGGTVTIPPGTCTWTSGITVNKGITLQGSGQNSTNLILANAGTLLGIRGKGGSSRITGIGFGQATSSSQLYITVEGNFASFRVDHSRFTDITGIAIIMGRIGSYDPAIPAINAVIDHITYTNSHNGVQFVRYYGKSTSWLFPDDFGDGRGLYIEDSNFSFDTGVMQNAVLDVEGGGRVTVRHNIFTNATTLWHDTGSTPQLRSTREYEIYDNAYNCTVHDCGWAPFQLRGGTGMIFDNVIATPTGNGFETAGQSEVFRSFYTGSSPWNNKCDSTPENICSDFRSHCAGGDHRACGGDYDCPSIGPCTANPCASGGQCGTGNTCVQMDGQQDSTGWPCRDQTGRGMDDPVTHVQQSSPMYWWGQRTPGGAVLPYAPATYTNYLKADRDFYTENKTAFNGTTGVGIGITSSRPTTCTTGVGYWSTDENRLYKCSSTNVWAVLYKPYTYPHPLASGGAVYVPPADTTPPAISSVASSAVQSTSATITWSTNEPAASAVYYGPSASYGSNSSSGSLLISHIATLTSLSSGTVYHFKVSATDAAGNTSSSPDQTFTTLGSAPVTATSTSSSQPTPSISVTTLAASSLVSSGAVLNGNAIASNGQIITSRGFQYGLTAIYGSNTTENGTSLSGSFSATVSGLYCNTLYHFRAYAKNSSGTVYGTDRTFATAACPATNNPSASSAGTAPGNANASSGAASPANNAAGAPPAAVSPSPVPAPVMTYSLNRNLYLGISGEDVKALQAFLNAQGFAVAASGPGSPGNESTYFGLATAAALVRFQAAKGIAPASGYFGPLTRTMLAQLAGGATAAPSAAAPISTPSPALSASTFTRNLFEGQSGGTDIQSLQAFLNSHGFQVSSSGAGSPGNETTYFGLKTRQALAQFQAANGISPAAGYFGPLTRAKIQSLLSQTR